MTLLRLKVRKYYVVEAGSSASRNVHSSVLMGMVSQHACAATLFTPAGEVQAAYEAHYDYRGRPRRITVQRGIVVADHGRCSDIGLAALEEGGSAVDAAVATALCQGLLNPMASGTGGGHFMLIRKPGGEAEVVDARELAPMAANHTMFVGKPGASLSGGLAVAVPLELRGLHLAHQRHGKLPWSRVLAPAVELARDGFPAHPYLVEVLRSSQAVSSSEAGRSEMGLAVRVGLIRDSGGRERRAFCAGVQLLHPTPCRQSC
jgi:gamma-glutamyltranspeptidase